MRDNYAISAYRHTEIPNKYQEPYTSNGMPNKYAGKATIPAWDWMIIAVGATPSDALLNAQRKILSRARLISPKQFIEGSDEYVLYNNLRIVKRGQLSKYRISEDKAAIHD